MHPSGIQSREGRMIVEGGDVETRDLVRGLWYQTATMVA